MKIEPTVLHRYSILIVGRSAWALYVEQNPYATSYMVSIILNTQNRKSWAIKQFLDNIVWSFLAVDDICHYSHVRQEIKEWTNP